jgi:hypothetical protein
MGGKGIPSQELEVLWKSTIRASRTKDHIIPPLRGSGNNCEVKCPASSLSGGLGVSCTLLASEVGPQE